jgi:hypothetical protein
VEGFGWVPTSRRWIPDVTLFVRANRGLIDWRGVAERSRQRGVSLDVADALEFLEVEFQLGFPRELLAQLRTSAGPSERVVHRVKMTPQRGSVWSRVVRRTVRACDALLRLALAPEGGLGRGRLSMLVEEFGARLWASGAVKAARGRATGRSRV